MILKFRINIKYFRESPQPVTKIPFQGKTLNQMTYTPKNGERTRNQRPQTKLGANPGEFKGATVSQVTYKNQSARPPTRYTANDHLGVGGQFFGKTTNAVDYVDHPLQGRPLRRRVISNLYGNIEMFHTNIKTKIFISIFQEVMSRSTKGF